MFCAFVLHLAPYFTPYTRRSIYPQSSTEYEHRFLSTEFEYSFTHLYLICCYIVRVLYNYTLIELFIHRIGSGTTAIIQSIVAASKSAKTPRNPKPPIPQEPLIYHQYGPPYSRLNSSTGVHLKLQVSFVPIIILSHIIALSLPP